MKGTKELRGAPVKASPHQGAGEDKELLQGICYHRDSTGHQHSCVQSSSATEKPSQNFQIQSSSAVSEDRLGKTVIGEDR